MDARSAEQIEDGYDDADKPLEDQAETVAPILTKSPTEIFQTAEQKEIIDLKNRIKQLESENIELAQKAKMQAQEVEQKNLAAKNDAESRYNDLFEKYQFSERAKYEAQEHAAFILDQNNELTAQVSKFQMELAEQFCEATSTSALMAKHERYIEELLVLSKKREQEHALEINELQRLLDEANMMLADADVQVERESSLVLRMQRENLDLAKEIHQLKGGLTVSDKEKLPVRKSIEPVVTVAVQPKKSVATKPISKIEKTKPTKVDKVITDFADAIGNRLRMFFKPEQPQHRNVQHRIQQPNMRGRRAGK